MIKYVTFADIPVGDQDGCGMQQFDSLEMNYSRALWAAASAAGLRVQLLEDGELLCAVTPEIPGPAFNCCPALPPGFLQRVKAHFAAHGVDGWAVAAVPAWPGTAARTTYSIRGARCADLADLPLPNGLELTPVDRSTTDLWCQLLVAASGFDADVASAWHRLSLPLAGDPDFRHFVLFEQGSPIGVSSFHIQPPVAYCGLTAVLPDHRGRGRQRAMLVSRARAARGLGCTELVARSVVGSASDRNQVKLDMAELGTRWLCALKDAP